VHAIAQLDVKVPADADKIAKLYMQLVITSGCAEAETWETRWCACNDQCHVGIDILRCGK
jgi:hypothetical protein